MHPLTVLVLGLLKSRHEISAWLSFARPVIRSTVAARRRSFGWQTSQVEPRAATPIVDAEFERVDADDDERKPTETIEDLSSKSLFQASLEADPDWNEIRIPFMDGDNFIDVKLAFMAELDGVKYGIGIPYDHAAAVTIEQKDGTIVNLSPDDPEQEEMIQIMAGQLQEHVGEDLALKRTPRILTIKGPLETYTKNWRDRVTHEAVDTKTLLDDSDEDLKFFHDFMKKELGEEEYRKTLEEDPYEIDDDILEIFGGIGEEGPVGVKDLFPTEIEGDDDLFIKEMEEFVNQDISHDGVALKLISYSLPDGNKYSVVQPLQPIALVGKFTQDEDDIRFDLLSPKDAELLVPRLEEACLEDLQKAGLSGDSIAT